MTKFAVNQRKRGARYDREADEAVQYPRRWVIFGPRVMTVRQFIEIEAKKQHSYDKRVGRAVGLQTQAEMELARCRRLARKTQDYIDAGKARLEMAERNGLSVTEFLELDRRGAREHWAAPHSKRNGNPPGPAPEGSYVD